MAEEKKKRFRPTLTEYRALQSDLEHVKECLHQTTRELVNAEDDKKDLQAKYDELHRLYDECSEESVENLKKEIESLQDSNGYLEDRIAKLNETIKGLKNEVEMRDADIMNMKHRSLWQRILNKV